MSSPRLIGVVMVSALLGGGVCAGAVALLGLGARDRTETVVQQAPLSAAATARGDEGALTPRDIYKRDGPGVVFVKSDVVQQTASPFDFGMPQSEQGTATGSGFVIDKAGDIVTNAHVIAGAVKVTVGLQDGKYVDARVIGKDTSSDLALLKVDPDGLDLRPLQLGSSRAVQVGDPVIAIGNPFGLDRTLTTGVVSALQRKIQAPNGFAIDNVIQTDAAINPGNSGGPLIDATGRVVGINSQIETGASSGSGSGDRSGGSIGIGFAVPIDTAKALLPQLKRTGKVSRGYLGISTATIDGSLASLDLPVKRGALVQTVQQGSPAAKAGVRAGDISAQVGGSPITIGGDIVTAVDGRPVAGSEDLQALVGAHKPGDEVTLSFLHGAHRQTKKVELGSRPASGG